MEKYINLVKELINYKTEQEWFEFKENWFEANRLGEYISALSNAAVIKKREFGYFIWGVNDKTHEILGSNFDFKVNVKGEPLEHFLARQLNPDTPFKFIELEIDEKRIIVLEVAAAKRVPTSFDSIRYIRIGSSKVKLSKYPEREILLFDYLNKEEKTLINTESEYQTLSFSKLFTYYAGKGIVLKQNNFKKNLGLLTKDGRYNLLAQILSDNSHIPLRVSIFNGEDKSSPLYSVKEFGNTCILVSLDKVLEYTDVINLIQANEKNRIVERTDIPLFDNNAFREAVINAFVHNLWIDYNAPMITIYSNRIEILSRGTLPSKQTLQGFYLGESVPVNQKLSDIFLQLHISERSGRGVPKIIDIYGKSVFEFRENTIVCNIPFNWISGVGDKPVYKVGDNNNEKALNSTQSKVLKEIRNNPNITHKQLMIILGLGKTAIQNNVTYLRENGYIERIGSNKSGYWLVK